ncbi:integrase core domain-containing protein [soil metagenome]
MPWQEVVTVELRQQFVQDALRRVVPVTELCAAYGISRKTGYKFLARYEAAGVTGLADQSRRPHRSPTALDPVLLQRLLEAHQRHPYWGPRKFHLVGQYWPDAPWPLRSTVARCFWHLGLVTACRRVRRPGSAGPPRTPMDAPNAVCTTDYKGQFKLGDGQYCFLLTVADGYSRMLLACQALTSTRLVEAQPVFERLFRTYGLPQRIRSDNGVPFATQALGRLSALAVWWIRLGILPDLIEPASPHQNGRHERMHLTLKRECTRPPRHSRVRQQCCFDRWRQECNTLRPHEALHDATPSSLYTPSPRAYPTRLPALEYPGHYEVRRVSRNGGIRWHKHWVNVSQTLGEEYVGFVEIDDSEWDVYFGPLRLGRFHERTFLIEDALGRQYRRHY